MKRSLYQTLEDKDNADQVEKHGPYLGNVRKKWLGDGYYFWESFIDLAKWWGDVSYQGNYMICETSYEYTYPNDDIYDLYQNEFLEEFREIAQMMMSSQGLRKEDVEVCAVIEYIKSKCGEEFSYKAIRSYPINSVSNDKFSSYRFVFSNRHVSYLDTCPAVQVCVIDKSILTSPFKVIYPEHYFQE